MHRGGTPAARSVKGAIVMWKVVERNPKYEVSDSGEVRLTETKQVLKQRTDRYGYPKVTFNENGQAKSTPTVHKLVADAFIPNPDNMPCINHKNENKCDNRVENLEWCTVAYNNRYGSHIEACAEGRRRPVSAFCDGEFVKTYPSAREASAELGIPWRYIGDAIYHRKGRKRAGGFEWRFAEKGSESHRQ